MKFLNCSKIKKSNVLKHLKKKFKCFKTFVFFFLFFSNQHFKFLSSWRLENKTRRAATACIATATVIIFLYIKPKHDMKMFGGFTQIVHKLFTDCTWGQFLYNLCFILRKSPNNPLSIFGLIEKIVHDQTKPLKIPMFYNIGKKNQMFRVASDA